MHTILGSQKVRPGGGRRSRGGSRSVLDWRVPSVSGVAKFYLTHQAANELIFIELAPTNVTCAAYVAIRKLSDLTPEPTKAARLPPSTFALDELVSDVSGSGWRVMLPSLNDKNRNRCRRHIPSQTLAHFITDHPTFGALPLTLPPPYPSTLAAI
jgi:hypothetical protein